MRATAVGLGALVAIAPALSPAVAAAAPPRVELVAEEELPPLYGQGIARHGDTWILSGTNVLARLDAGLDARVRVAPAIPAGWAARGYNHVGDVDVHDAFVYAPLEQPEYEAGRQAIARFDAMTLEFVDAVEVPQHEASFVTIDDDGIAYSMDRFGGDALTRYDTGAGWAPLPPLGLSRRVERVQGADVRDGAVWLSTDDDRTTLYHVDLATGTVTDAGSLGHVDGEGEGIDVTPVGDAALHTLTIDARIAPVWLGHFAVAGDDLAVDGAQSTLDAGWPPFLVAATVAGGVAVVVGLVVVLRRARAALRRG